MYRVVSVFDASQTEGKPLPQLASNLTGDVKQYEIFMEALQRSSPAPIAFEAMQTGMDGYFSESGQRIAIRSGMSEVQTVSAAIHEIAHSKLHNYEKNRFAAAQVDETASPPKPKDRCTEEVEAESVSYAVCAYYGIATGENSLGYIATWSKDKELPELRYSLETINKTASGLIDDIDRHFTEIVKERGIDLSSPEQKQMESEPVILYQTHSNPRSEGKHDRSFIQAYTRTDGELIPGEVIGVGTADMCISLANKLNGGDILPEQAKTELENSPVITDSEREMFLDTPGPPAANDYPMPDPAISIEARNAYGYTDDDMLPLSRERAIELYEKDLTIYMLYDNNDAGMVFDREDIENHTGIFGIACEEWEASQDYLSLPEGRESTQKELENRFFNSPSDAFAIFQIKESDELRDIRFEPISWVQSVGRTVERGNYNLIYTGQITDTGSTIDRLNTLWDRFNNDHPQDFRGHSLSVSDIVALKQNGAVSCHYVDSLGFQELPAFLKPENYLENAEMAIEDDYGMIDGIINNGKNPSVAELEQQAKTGQQISLTELARAANAERTEKRKSVLERLATPHLKPERNKTAPSKGMEMER
jgi:hypothetical protein